MYKLCSASDGPVAVWRPSCWLRPGGEGWEVARTAEGKKCTAIVVTPTETQFDRRRGEAEVEVEA